MENLRLYLATYNVGTSNPDQRLMDFLSLNNHKNEKLADFFVIGLQEVKSQPQNMLMDTLFDDAWTLAIRDILDHKGYIKLKSIRLQGLVLMVFTLRKHLLNIREIESEYTRTGLAGMWGNKGAVSIRLSIYGCSLCFVNAHLCAHDHQLKERIEDYNSIIKDHDFHVEETTKIFYHDYVFFMGDLNFRLLMEYERTPDEIERMILKKDIKKLFEYDQLRLVMKSGEAFSEFTEKDPDFPPTFKYDVGTSSYDHKRRPAWCDRILYCVNSNNYENVTLKVDQLSYKSHPSYILSDHKPVSADFAIKIPHPVTIRPRAFDALSNKTVCDQVFSDYSEHVVQFDRITSWEEGEDNKAYYRITKDIPATKDDWIQIVVLVIIPHPVTIRPRAFDALSNKTVCDQVFSDYSEHVVQFDRITSWEEGEDNKAYYRITKDIPATKDDWIGLFKDHFASLDDYVTYEYVSKCATPTDEVQGPPAMERPQKYEVTIPDVPSRCRGNYCLVYFSQSEDKVMSVMGVSEPFPIVKIESD